MKYKNTGSVTESVPFHRAVGSIFRDFCMCGRSSNISQHSDVSEVKGIPHTWSSYGGRALMLYWCSHLVLDILFTGDDKKSYFIWNHSLIFIIPLFCRTFWYERCILYLCNETQRQGFQDTWRTPCLDMDQREQMLPQSQQRRMDKLKP